MLKLIVKKVGKDNCIFATEIKDGTNKIVYEWEGLVPPLYLNLGWEFIRRDAGEGQRIPPWYYGLSYTEDFSRIYVFHLMPFNLLVRAARWLGYGWGWLRTRQSWFDIQLDYAYQRGCIDGRERLLREVAVREAEITDAKQRTNHLDAVYAAGTSYVRRSREDRGVTVREGTTIYSATLVTWPFGTTVMVRYLNGPKAGRVELVEKENVVIPIHE